MAEDLMRAAKNKVSLRSEGGFSMIEMLMTAFVLAVGILGLTMLQALSLRAARGAKSLQAAVLVAERVMDQVEMEGRLSWLNLTASNSASPSLSDISDIRYVNLASGETVNDEFNLKGGAVDPNSQDPAENTAFYHAVTKRSNAIGAVNGHLSDITVVVTFTDGVDSSNQPISRSVTLSRRIVHG